MTGTTGSDATGIAARPEVDRLVVALVAAAVEQVWPRPRVMVAEPVGAMPAWRFSGRWWSRPANLRRERPWAAR